MQEKDFLRTSGIHLVNRDGERVILRGTNLGGWLHREGWMDGGGAHEELNEAGEQVFYDDQGGREILRKRFGKSGEEALLAIYQEHYITETDFSFIKSIGLNFVRLPIFWQEVMDEEGRIKDNAWDQIDFAVTQCEEKGLYIMLDLHGTRGGHSAGWLTGGHFGSNEQWTNALYQEQTVKLWEAMAARYRGNPTVAAYDLLNEPVPQEGCGLSTADYYDRLYKAVRKVDPEHIISFGAFFDFNALGDPAEHQWENVIYQTHHYPDDKRNGGKEQLEFARNTAAYLKEHQQKWQVPVLAGEFNFWSYMDVWEEWFSMLEETGISWSSWCYKNICRDQSKNWGLYHDCGSALPDMEKDSYEELSRKLAGFSSEYYQRNENLARVMRRFAFPQEDIVPERALPSDGWTAAASENTQDAENVLRPGRRVGWNSRARILSGQWFCIDMREYRMVDGVVMDAGEGERSFPRRFHVQVSVDGLGWTNVCCEKYDEVKTGVYEICFQPAAARFVRIINTESYVDREFGHYYEDTQRWGMKRLYLLGDESVHPPVIKRMRPVEILAGEEAVISFELAVENQETVCGEEELVWNCSGLPGQADFQKGVLRWTPAAEQGGTWHPVIEIEKSSGGRDSILAEIIVKAPIRCKESYSFSLQAGDLLEEKLCAENVQEYAAEQMPDWINLHPGTGVLSLAPGREQQGHYQFAVTMKGVLGDAVKTMLDIEVLPFEQVSVLSYGTSQDGKLAMTKRALWGKLEEKRSDDKSGTENNSNEISSKENNSRENDAAQIFHVDRTKLHQAVYGFGSSLDGSTLYNLIHLSPEPRVKLMETLFHPTRGGNWNFFRICFGSSDFASDEFRTYDDMPEGGEDFELANFSIERDIAAGYVDYLKEIRRMNPEIQYVASVWSPPAWMKTNRSLVSGGSVREECFEVLADYYVKCIQAYEAEGVPVYAITIQNEPDVVQPYPTTAFTGDEQKRFVKLLRRKLDANGIKVKVWIMDTNFTSVEEYGWKLLRDDEVNQAFDGVAFHDYGGEPEAMGEVKRSYTNKTMHITERSTYDIQGADRVIRYFRNGAETYCAWLIFLDEKGEPAIGPLNGAFPVQPIRCRPGERDQWYCTGDYYYYCQVARFVQKGAHVIDCEYGSVDTITGIAFLNPDQSVVLYLVNQTDQEQAVEGIVDGTSFQDRIPAKTAVTYLIGRE